MLAKSIYTRGIRAVRLWLGSVGDHITSKMLSANFSRHASSAGLSPGMGVHIGGANLLEWVYMGGP
jgi:hypothetical protein